MVGGGGFCKLLQVSFRSFQISCNNRLQLSGVQLKYESAGGAITFVGILGGPELTQCRDFDKLWCVRKG